MAEGLRPNIGFNRGADATVGRAFAARPKEFLQNEALRFLPLRWLPDRRERLKTGYKYLGVAGHEAGHLLTAMSLGYIGDVSFVPDGNSLARVSLYGDIPVEDLKTIAAAGMVDTPFGSATGYGSDKFKVRLMRFLYGGKGVNESQAAAEATLKSYGPVRERFSEIIAYLAANGRPNISANGIRQIYQRAMGELAVEKLVPYEQAEDPKIVIKPYENEVRTVISEEPGYVVVTKKRITDRGETNENSHVCTKCLGIDGHYPDCKTNKKEAKKDTVKNQRLFDWNERVKQLTTPILGVIGQALRQFQTKQGW